MPENSLKKISIVIPVYNEEDNLVPVVDRVRGVFASLAGKYEYEIILVDDGSRDKSREILQRFVREDRRVKYISFSRNFGKEAATTAGLNYAQGEAVVILDCDLQHPPEIIPRFIHKWESGASTVIGVRREHNGAGLFKRAGSYLFYKIMGWISETELTPNATDFRLVDRAIVNEFNNFTERSRLTRGLLDWLGFERDYIHFNAGKRVGNRVGYSKLKLVKLAMSSLVSHSLLPLKLAAYLGVVIVFISGALGLFIFVEKYLMGDPFGLNFSGPAMLAVFNSFLIGIVLCCLGLMALYIASIHGEVANRPLYVVRDKNINKTI